MGIKGKTAGFKFNDEAARELTPEELRSRRVKSAIVAQEPALANAESKGFQRVLRSYTTQGITVEEVPFLYDAETGEFFFDADVAQTLYQALRALPNAQALAEKVGRLSEALEWYAEPSIYQQEHFEGTGMEYPALVDGGHTARAALAAAEAQP